MRALIGYSGFVGSNIDGNEIDARYNSKNIHEARGKHFSEVFCAGVQAVKWWSNKNPKEDWEGIENLLNVLADVEAERFVLISTVDVYKNAENVNENSAISTDGLHPYGLHRYRVEEFVKDRFGEKAVIIRLPGLFGRGLKKNLIFDLLENRDVSGLHAKSTFQFYDLRRLRSDMATILSSGHPLINIATEPVSVAEVFECITGEKVREMTSGEPVRYDMQTAYAALWGRSGVYLENSMETLGRIRDFSRDWKA